VPDAAMTFADRLNLALKSLSIGRTRIASDLGVDKSMVSRWLGGTARPSTQNLERLTRLIAVQCPGFSLLDWESDPEQFARRVGMNPRDLGSIATANESAPVTSVPQEGRTFHPGILPFGLMDRAATETRRRAAVYIGRWRMTRLTSSGASQIRREFFLIARDGDGLRFELRCFAEQRLGGWMIVSEGKLYGMGADRGDNSITQLCLNGVTMPRAVRLEGILLGMGGVGIQVPFAELIVLDRVGESLDPAADSAWLDDATLTTGFVEASEIDPAILAKISRGSSVCAFDGESAAVLRLPPERTVIEGSY
jgi:hypothetical protein